MNRLLIDAITRLVVFALGCSLAILGVLVDISGLVGIGAFVMGYLWHTPEFIDSETRAIQQSMSRMDDTTREEVGGL